MRNFLGEGEKHTQKNDHLHEKLYFSHCSLRLNLSENKKDIFSESWFHVWFTKDIRWNPLFELQICFFWIGLKNTIFLCKEKPETNVKKHKKSP